ncbi:glycosyltransferase family 2 protein [Amylibacter sp.]|nr:glycosyltransferase family 2 protein [Amylibacter sp.]
MSTKKYQYKVTVITVTYNSLKVLPNMLSSIGKGTSIVIVDNSSDDIKHLRAISKKYKAQLIENKSNLGFGTACNIGAANAETDYILFLNPDTMLNESTIESLLDAADKYPKASAMNPKIFDDKGKPYLKRRSHLLPRHKWIKQNLLKNDREVSILSGSAIFLSKKNFMEVKGFDENIFLFHEDDDLCLRLEKKCGPLMYINKAEIKHLSGSSSVRSNKIAAYKAWHMGNSKIYTINKHSIRFGKTFTIIQSLLKLVSPENFILKRQLLKNYFFFKGILYACIFEKL